MSTEPGKKPRPAGRWPEIPGYQVEQEIGRGATGVVYRARQLAVGREVALKVLHKELATKPRVVHRLQREARTTARLNHPHIVTAIDMGQVEGLWWFAMELVDGPSLAKHLKQEGRLSERHALRLFIPLCEALQYAWEQGVVHRDIKPSNVLLDRVGVARLADLGLAFRDDDPLLTSTGDTLGTPHYISPEQARDSATVDVRSDIWSFGATLFHAVCGRAPFAGESVAEVLSGVLYAQIPDPRALEPSLSHGLVLVLRKCLARDPERRYQTPRELLLDLERVRERRQPKVMRAELEPLAGERGWRVWVGVAALVLVAVVSLWLAVSRPWSARVGGDPSARGPSPLDELRTAALTGGATTASALERLEAVRVELPSSSLEDWREIRSALRERARAELESLRDSTDAAVEAALANGDFDAAERALGDDLTRRLYDATGYSLESVPASLSSLPGWTSMRLREVGSARRGREAIERGLYDFARVSIAPRVDRLEADGRWREAFDALALTDDELLSGARLDAGLRPPPAEVFDQARELLRARRTELERSWSRVDRELALGIERAGAEIEQELDQDRPLLDAAERLDEALAALLAEAGLSLDRLPLDPRPEGLAALESWKARLIALEDRILRGRLERRFRDLDAESSELLREREFAGAVRLWRNLQDEFASEVDLVAESPGATPWRAGLARLVELRRTEAEWLEELLLSAAVGVTALDGSTVRLHYGTQRVRGRLIAGPDPSSAGFRVVSEDGLPLLFQLRRVRADELEQLLVGWTERPEDMARPRDRLLRALFRFREGDWAAASDVLASGPLPVEWNDLVLELESRIQAAREIQRVRLTERTDRAADMLSRARGGSIDPEGRLILVESLLRDFSDVDVVAANVSELRSLQRELRSQSGPRAPTQDDFTAVYGTSRVDMLDGSRVRLGFSFEEGEPGAWSPGSWIGWTGSTGGMNWEDLLARPGPSLELATPLSIDGGELVLELRIEQPDASGPPGLLLVSIAGVHFALVGRGLPGAAEVGCRISTDPLPTFVQALRSGLPGERGDEILKRGERQRLRLRIDRRRRTASLEVRLDDEGPESAWREVLVRRSLREPADASSIVLRSWEPVRLIGATLEGHRVR